MKNILKSLIYKSLILTVACTSDPKEVEVTSEMELKSDTLTTEPSKLDIPIIEFDLFIERNQFYGIKLQDPFSELQEKYPDRLEKGIKRTGEGTFQVYKIIGEDGAHLGNIYPDQKNENLVGQIEIISAEAKTKNDIRIGNTFKELQAEESDLEVHGSESEGRTYASKDGIYYRLEMNHFAYDLDQSTIKPDVKIIEIVIR